MIQPGNDEAHALIAINNENQVIEQDPNVLGDRTGRVSVDQADPGILFVLPI